MFLQIEIYDLKKCFKGAKFHRKESKLFQAFLKIGSKHTLSQQKEMKYVFHLLYAQQISYMEYRVLYKK